MPRRRILCRFLQWANNTKSSAAPNRCSLSPAAAQPAAEQLTLALLAKAFRGELVPQEPASELLKRLVAKRSRSPRQPT